MKKLLWALLVLLLAIGAGSGWVYRSRDALLARAIRTYGPEITGVSVTLDKVQLSPVDGMATMDGLRIGNPAGFKTPHALAVGQFSIQLDPSTLRKPVVHIREIRIDQPDVAYEHVSGGSNLDVIQRHVEAYVASHDTGSSPSGTAAAGDNKTRVVIDQFNMRRAQARVSAELLPGGPVTVVLPDIRLRDIGKAAGGITPAEATAQIVGAIRQETTRAVMPLHLDGMVGGIKKGASALVDKLRGFFK
jgi:hypothetical protein